jgi:Zn-dependent peptidase ImmA (M78 family)/transcriptional regulator with XRE-family HTH domain
VPDHLLSSIDPATIGARLAGARKARGLTQQQAAAALGVARTTLTAIEKGERRPRAAELVRLAALYGRQVGDLMRPLPAREADSFVVQFRAARTPGDSPADERRHADVRAFQEFCDDYLELERLTGAPLPRRYPDEYPTADTDPERAAEEIATSERMRLGLGDGPLADLWGLLETDVGLRVFALPFTDGRLAGLFAYTAEHGGCIAVNANHPEERRRWSAAHEYGHFLTDRHHADVQVLPRYRRLPEAERLADAFARFFLIPGSGLVRRFQATRRAKDGPITPADVLTLCQLYRVSFQAMVLRLEELKLLTAGTWDGLSAEGFKPDAARALLALPPIAHELPRLPYRYEALAVQAFAAGDLSEGQLARVLRTDRVAVRDRIRELTGTRFFEDGEVLQLALNLDHALVGSPR